MELKIKKYCFDIKTAIESINEFMININSISEYQKNKLVKRAVEREIEIIGEAMNQLLKYDSNIQIENARKIINTRNWVIHGYDSVDDKIIWDIIISHLPILYSDVLKILDTN